MQVGVGVARDQSPATNGNTELRGCLVEPHRMPYGFGVGKRAPLQVPRHDGLTLFMPA